MHGGHAIEELRVDKLQARLEEFKPNYHRHGTADKEHHQRKDQVHRPDVFVISGGKPAEHAALVAVAVIVVNSCVAHSKVLVRCVSLFVSSTGQQMICG